MFSPKLNVAFSLYSSKILVNAIVTNQAAIDRWKKRDVTCRNYIMVTNEPSQKKNIYGLSTAREMWLKIETQYASNAADLEANCLTSLYNFKHDPGKDIMCHINGVLAFTNKLREIGKPMAELHIINIITSSLPESYARARSIWTLVPEAERTVNNLISKLKAEETIIASYLKPAKEDIALHASEKQTDTERTSIFTHIKKKKKNLYPTIEICLSQINQGHHPTLSTIALTEANTSTELREAESTNSVEEEEALKDLLTLLKSRKTNKNSNAYSVKWTPTRQEIAEE